MKPEADPDEINAPESLLRRLERTPNPNLYYEYGEDPARFLGLDPRPKNRSGVDPILARIRGLEDVELLGEYLEIEASVFKRRRVVAALNRQKKYLEERGGPKPRVIAEPEQLDEDQPEPVWRHACGSTDVERESGVAWYCNECEVRTPKTEVELVEPGIEEVPA